MEVGRVPLHSEGNGKGRVSVALQGGDIPDAELVARSLDGESCAFDVLVRRHQHRVFHVAFRLVGNHEDALDVAQEVFVRAYKGLDTFRGDAQFSTWLYRIAVNMARNHLRNGSRKGRNKGVPLDNADPDMPAVADTAASPMPAPDKVAVARELDMALQEALAGLPEACREAFVLRIFENLRYEEIAAVMDCPEGTVKSRLNQARRLLRERLAALAIL